MSAMSRLIVTFVLIVGPLTSCGGRTLEAPPEEPYPPNDAATLARIFDPHLEPMGLRLVRGRLIDRSGGGYEPSDTGTHLALYAEPFGKVSAERYVSNIVPLTRVFVPEVFDRWARLESFDICQEPLKFVNDDPEPPPVSQVTVHRSAVADVDWKRLDLAGLIRASRRHPQEVGMILAPVLRRTPRIRALYEPGPNPSA